MTARNRAVGGTPSNGAVGSQPTTPQYRHLPVAHLTENDLARRWRLSPRTLQSWRWRKVGPPFIRLQGKVLYRLADIVEYEIANLRQADR